MERVRLSISGPAGLPRNQRDVKSVADRATQTDAMPENDAAQVFG
jgi:hypothetical protein